MHRGRSYPFMPDRWAALAWFWPGCVPWKVWLVCDHPSDFPWEHLGNIAGQASDAGIVAADGTSVDYGLGGGLLPAGVTLDVICERGMVAGLLTAKWRVQLYESGILTGYGIANQPYPQNQFFIDRWDDTLSPGGSTMGPPPPITIRPATYAEGGSPYV